MKLRYKLLPFLFFLIMPSVYAALIPEPINEFFFYIFGRDIPPVYSQKAIFAIIIMCVLLIAFKAIKWKGGIPVTLSIILAIISGIGVPPTLTQAMFNTWGVVGGIIVNVVICVLLIAFAHMMANAFGSESTAGKLISAIFYLFAGVLFFGFGATWGAIELGGQNLGGIAKVAGFILIIIAAVKAVKAFGGGGFMFKKPGKAPKLGLTSTTSPEVATTEEEAEKAVAAKEDLDKVDADAAHKEGTITQEMGETEEEIGKVDTEEITNLKETYNILNEAIEKTSEGGRPIDHLTNLDELRTKIDNIRKDEEKIRELEYENLGKSAEALELALRGDLQRFTKGGPYKKKYLANLKKLPPEKLKEMKINIKELEKDYENDRKVLKGKEDAFNKVIEEIKYLNEDENWFKTRLGQAINALNAKKVGEARHEILEAIKIKENHKKVAEKLKEYNEMIRRFERYTLRFLGKELGKEKKAGEKLKGDTK